MPLLFYQGLEKSNGQIKSYVAESAIFGHLGVFLNPWRGNKNFLQKSALATFPPLLSFICMQNFRNIVIKRTEGLTRVHHTYICGSKPTKGLEPTISYTFFPRFRKI